MTRLELAKLMNTLAGTQGVVDTTVGLTGYQNTLVVFMDQAYNDIQIYRSSWKFLRRELPIALSDSVDSFFDLDIDIVDRIIYNKSILREVPYDDWVIKDHKLGKPVEYTRSPIDDSIIFNPSDMDYLLTLQYTKVPDVMTVNTSVPVLPIKFHTIIVYKALIGLGSYLGNYDLISKYSLKYSIEIGQLMRSQIPQTFVRTPPLVY